MDNVMNRPLFRRRDARDRLNDMAGVQGYDVGGPIESAGIPSIMDQIRASGMSTLPPPMAAAFGLADLLQQPSEAPLSAREKQAAETGSMLRTGLDYGAGALSAAGTGLYGAAADVLSPAFATLGATSLAAELERQSDIAYNIALSNLMNGLSATEGMSVEDFDLEPDQFNFAVAKAREDARTGAARSPRTGPRTPGDEQGPMAYSTPAELEAVKPLAVRTGPRTPGDEQGPMAYSPRAEPAEPAEPTAPTAPAVPTGQSGMEADARGRGPLITNPTAVAAGLNDPDPAARERTAADFMKEYMAGAPEYEGMDKNMMRAMIGFSIAAGESPNAMSNIANGLQAGAQMFLQDKADKDAFNRQIQLSALQYGMGEVAKDRELTRQATDYVASRDVTYRGTKYGPGESIPVLHSDIINGRMPPGVVSEGVNEAMLATDAAVRKSLIEAQADGTLKPEQYRQTIAELDKAASDFSKARNTIPLIEASIMRNADGEVTGLKANAMKAVNQAASFAGIDLGAEFESPEAYQSAMQTVAARMVQNILGESGANISNVDRELVAAIVGVASGGYGNAFKDPQVLNAKLQEILQQAEGQQQSALDTYNTLMEGFGSTLSPSGTPVRSLRAERVFAPEEPVQAFEYTVDENGRYVKRYLDGGN